jgi:hypothetical protein
MSPASRVRAGGGISSWRIFEEEAPALAEFGARRLTDSGVAYLATVDETGAPRVHPVTPILAPGHLFVFMEPTSPKGRDLARGSRYALHCTVEDPDGGGGEFLVRGSAREITDPQVRSLAVSHAPYAPADRYVLFELTIDAAFSTVYGDKGDPLRNAWSPSERS